MTMLPDMMIALIPSSWKIGAMVRIHQRSRFTLGYGYYFNFKEPLGPWRLITGLWSYGAQTTAGGPPKVGAWGRLLAEARHTRTGGMARVLSRTPGDRHLHPQRCFTRNRRFRCARSTSGVLRTEDWFLLRSVRSTYTARRRRSARRGSVGQKYQLQQSWLKQQVMAIIVIPLLFDALLNTST